MNKLLCLLVLCAVSLPQMATASDHDLQDTLNHQFKDKILILRHPMGNESLRYDAQGNALKRGPEGDWTLYGAVRIEKIEVGGGKLRLQGTRLCIRRAASGLAPFEFKRPKDRETPPVKPSVKVEISFDQPLSTADQAQTLLGNVFALNKGDFLDSVPAFWRGYLDGYFNDFDFKQGKEMDFKPEKPAPRRNALSRNGNTGQPPAAQENGYADEKIHHVGGDVKAPKPTFTPEPEFSEPARYEKFQGVVVVDLVVGTDGKVHNSKVVRALGLGLDEKAVTMIGTWRFDPAKLNGKPVAVEMNVEVAFNLY